MMPTMTPHRVAAALLTAVLALTGCGSQELAAAPSPSVTPDKFAVDTCEYLAVQDPGNGYANDFALTMAGMSSVQELVRLAGAARQAGGDANTIRGWCQRNVPRAGVEVATPAPG